MATPADSRINDPDGLLAGRIVNPETVAANSTQTGDPDGSGSGNDQRATGDSSAGSDHYARDENGNVKRNKDGTPQRKRGRRAGTANHTQSSAKNQANIKGLEKILYSLHVMASVSIAPELAIDEQEAAMLAQAAKSVQDFYNFETSAEVMLWVNVIGICGAVYGPRILAVTARKKAQKKKEPKPVSDSAPIATQSNVIEGVTFPHHAPTQ